MDNHDLCGSTWMLIDVNSIGYHIERKIKRLYNNRIDIILIIIFIVLLITKVFTILIPILISYFDGLCFFENKQTWNLNNGRNLEGTLEMIV